MNTFLTVDTSYGFCINVLRTRCYRLSFHRPIIPLYKYANSFAIVCLRVEITGKKGIFWQIKKLGPLNPKLFPDLPNTLPYAGCS